MAATGFAYGGLVLTRAAWAFVQYEYAAGITLAFGMDAWLAQSIMPGALLVMTLRFALGALTTLLQVVRRQPAS